MARKEDLLSFEELESIPGIWSSDRINGRGLLLDAVQRNRIFPDSKTFVDMPMKEDPDVILKKYKYQVEQNGQLSKEHLQAFVDEHFLPPGGELEEFNFIDLTESPAFLDSISNPVFKSWARELNQLWKILGRRMKSFDEKRTSLLYVPNGFVVPGDRFREFYYWDTYWIVKGLLVSGMTNTTKGVIENLLHVVKKHGFVPNGGRDYYLNRSQPALLTPMVDLYYEVTNNVAFVEDNFHLLEAEYKFWLDNKSVKVTIDGKEYNLYQYRVDLRHPRAEGYVEDLEAVVGMPKEQSAAHFSHLATAAESGWDFSTRWFEWDGINKETLPGIKTTHIVPVDLNTFLYLTEKALAKFAGLIGKNNRAEYYENQAQQHMEAMEAVFWHEEDGVWYDYDHVAKLARRRFFMSNITPLMTRPTTERVERVVKYLQNEDVLNYPGGVPTSKTHSGQQWDFPNVWPPSIEILITGLVESASENAKKVGLKLMQTWVNANYAAWKRTGFMFEKYSADKEGSTGQGGEYVNQVGFGWSNGVILHFLHRYGNQLQTPPM